MQFPMSNRLRASLIAGAVMGGLSAVTVLQHSFIRLICCLWAILGGALAAYLYIRKSPTPARVGEGAILGMLSGVFGALIAFVAFLLTSFYITDRSLFEDQLTRAGFDPEQVSYPLVMVLVGVLAIIVQVGLSLLGGIIGVAIFENRGDGGPGETPPPPPPYYGGTPEATYTSPRPPDSQGPSA